jgi:hypothetical protein
VGSNGPSATPLVGRKNRHTRNIARYCQQTKGYSGDSGSDAPQLPSVQPPCTNSRTVPAAPLGWPLPPLLQHFPRLPVAPLLPQLRMKRAHANVTTVVRRMGRRRQFLERRLVWLYVGTTVRVATGRVRTGLLHRHRWRAGRRRGGGLSGCRCCISRHHRRSSCRCGWRRRRRLGGSGLSRNEIQRDLLRCARRSVVSTCVARGQRRCVERAVRACGQVSEAPYR